MADEQGVVYYLYKEGGETSFQAIRRLQKLYGLKKVGHCGTLDKFAEGLLLVMSGPATKLAGAITGLDKSYFAEVELGRETDTLDPEGSLVATSTLPSETQIRAAFVAWMAEIAARDGRLQQVPPHFSAIHLEGKRLYQRALAGEDLSDLPAREVRLFHCELVSWQAPLLSLKLHCSKGFYVRSFARDLARRCGSLGYLRSLQRSAIGSIPLSAARTLVQEPRPVSAGNLLLRLKDELALQVWQVGVEVYGMELPGEDLKLLQKGQIPKEICYAAQKKFLKEKMQGENQEFALLYGGKILGLFRYSGGKVRFWHNFSQKI